MKRYFFVEMDLVNEREKLGRMGWYFTRDVRLGLVKCVIIGLSGVKYPSDWIGFYT